MLVDDAFSETFLTLGLGARSGVGEREGICMITSFVSSSVRDSVGIEPF